MQNKKYLYNILMALVLTTNITAASNSLANLNLTNDPFFLRTISSRTKVETVITSGNPESVSNMEIETGFFADQQKAKKEQRIHNGASIILKGTIFDENNGKYSREERSQIIAQKFSFQSKQKKKLEKLCAKTSNDTVDDLINIIEALEKIEIHPHNNRRVKEIDNKINSLIEKLTIGIESDFDIGTIYLNDINALNYEIKALNSITSNDIDTPQGQKNDTKESEFKKSPNISNHILEDVPSSAFSIDDEDDHKSPLISSTKANDACSFEPDDKVNLKNVINALQQGLSKISAGFSKILKIISAAPHKFSDAFSSMKSIIEQYR